MSFYVNCVQIDDGSIQATLDPYFSSRHQYEMALKEIFLPLQWKIDKGYIELYKDESLVLTLYLSGFEGDSIEKFVNLFQLLLIQKKVDRDQVRFSNRYSLISFKATAPYKFKLSEKAQTFLNINKTYITIHNTFVQTPFLTENAVINVYSDVAGEQIYGERRKQLLKSIPIKAYNDKICYCRYENPDYIDISRSQFNKINIWFEDMQNSPIKVESNRNLLIKLHFRPKR